MTAAATATAADLPMTAAPVAAPKPAARPASAIPAPPAAEPLDDDFGSGRYEVIDGVRVEKTMSSIESRLAFKLGHVVETFAESRRLGLAFTDMLFRLNAVGQRYAPDVAFVSRRKWPHDYIPRFNGWPIVPDLAVEVISPTDLAVDVAKKLDNYMRAGVRLVWEIYPDLRRIQVRDARTPEVIRVVGAEGTLDGSDVLPEFTLSAAEVFSVVPPDLQPAPVSDE
jgi:Uma2 family endonuclease